MLPKSMRQFKQIRFMAVVAALSITSVVAQAANFGSIDLAPGFDPASAIASGSTGGSFSLPTISQRDRHGNFCLGYSGSQTPDHVLTLEKDFPRLILEVKSRSTPTTLVIKGPNDVIRCGDNSIDDTNWKAGKYQIWVGSKDPGVSGSYTLSVREPS